MRKSLASILLVLVAGLAAGCAARKPPPPPPAAVAVAKPLQRTLVDWDDYEGQFTAVDSVDVRPRVSGYLQSVGFKDGEIVRKGQVLFVIDPRPYQAALDQAKGAQAHAQAALDNARIEAARGQTLLSARAISQQAFDALQATERQDAADLVSAQASVRTAALNLEFTRVIAPLSGRISDRRVAPGNLVVADNTVLTNIVNLNPIWFSFTGSEALYLKYLRESAAGTRLSSRQVANPVEVRLEDEASYRWKGHMDFVDNSLDSGSGTIRGRAVIDNPDLFLTPGMFGHMRLKGSGAYPALLTPDRAIVTDQTRQVVYMVRADGVVVEKPVALGPLYQGLRVIHAGVGADDQLIVDGLQRVRPGEKVTPHTVAIAPEAAAPVGQGYEDLAPPAASASDADQSR
jgi:RND family efflux transporter MFP subunit